MESKKSIKLSEFLICFAMLLSGFAVGLNVGSQLFTERPDFITWILVGVIVLTGVIIPFVKKREEERK